MNIKELIEALGIPCAYDHFAEGESPDPPFSTYRYPESHNFGADNMVWTKATVVYLELYTEKKDLQTENNIEQALTEHGIYFDKSETWIDSEQLYEVLYSFEMEVQ